MLTFNGTLNVAFTEEWATGELKIYFIFMKCYAFEILWNALLLRIKELLEQKQTVQKEFEEKLADVENENETKLNDELKAHLKTLEEALLLKYKMERIDLSTKYNIFLTQV